MSTRASLAAAVAFLDAHPTVRDDLSLSVDTSINVQCSGQTDAGWLYDLAFLVGGSGQSVTVTEPVTTQSWRENYTYRGHNLRFTWDGVTFHAFHHDRLPLPEDEGEQSAEQPVAVTA